MVFTTAIGSQLCLALIWCEGRSALSMDTSTQGGVFNSCSQNLALELHTCLGLVCVWGSLKCLAHRGIPMS